MALGKCQGLRVMSRGQQPCEVVLRHARGQPTVWPAEECLTQPVVLLQSVMLRDQAILCGLERFLVCAASPVTIQLIDEPIVLLAEIRFLPSAIPFG